MNADVHSLAGPYALDALEPPERERFERHLATCATCRDEVRELTATATRLGSATASPPPPALRARVLAEVAATRQLPPLAGSPDSRQTRRRGGRHGSRDLPTWRGRLLAAAAALVVLAGAGAAVVEVRRAQEEAQQVAEQAAERQAEITSLLAAPDSRTLHGDVRGGGRVTAVVSAREDRGMVLLDALPASGPEETYQLWLINDSGARSAGTVDVTRPGHQSRIVGSGVSTTQAIGLTVEPRGGSQAPTTDPIALVSLED